MRRVGLLYLGTLAALAGSWAVPDSMLLGLPLALRVLAAVTIAFAPVAMANLAFSTRFAQAADSRSAFGTNVLGAMVGGCLEYGSLLVGYRWLLAVTALLYVSAFVFTPRARIAAPSV